MNRVILQGLKCRLAKAKKGWVEDLHNILWSYGTMPYLKTDEILFRLTYGAEAIIPMEIMDPSKQTEAPLDEELNEEALREEIDLAEEIRSREALREAIQK